MFKRPSVSDKRYHSCPNSQQKRINSQPNTTNQNDQNLHLMFCLQLGDLVAIRQRFGNKQSRSDAIEKKDAPTSEKMHKQNKFASKSID